jgi:hypothetical protein
MSDFKIRWKNGNREFLFEASKYVVITVLLILSGIGLTMPTGAADRLLRVIERGTPPATADPGRTP